MGSWRGEWQRMEARVEGVSSYRESSEGCHGPHNHHRAASEKERELTLFPHKDHCPPGARLTQAASLYWLPSFLHLRHHRFYQHGCRFHIDAQNLKPTESKTTSAGSRKATVSRSYVGSLEMPVGVERFQG